MKQWDTITHLSGWLKTNKTNKQTHKQEKPSIVLTAGEDEGYSFIADENAKWNSYFGRKFARFLES